ncbi:zinc-binding dehydrogenase [Salinibacterium sp. NK8237]|uniref:zinc-binding dehydrogenase n=1 Tax=Salinibacterium sp. NK8237 TaxID=2792038 RepID=UPI0018CD0124|nr:zinc-binding dehydrogenase [Salinibacterium sp. NK8237]MBH0130104.1 zinc-binding dehydrogenase [Salinibacterium sp. NK8237]
MKAITFSKHGGSEVLEYSEVDRPSPGVGEVLLKIHAVAINHGPDIETRRRGFGMGAIAMPHIGGVDPAGEIVELGAEVTEFALGDRVAVYPVIACGVCEFCSDEASENYCSNSVLYGVQTDGGRAEFAVAPASQLVRLPTTVSYEAAAALGVAYTTTWHGLMELGKLTADDTFLVVGAGGGCGVAAVQLAKIYGATVIAITGSEWKQEKVRELGADAVFSYRDKDWPDKVREFTGGRGVTIAFDNAGTETLPSSISCLARGGRLFCSGGTTGFEVSLDLRQLYRNLISLLFYVQGGKADMEKLVALVADGSLNPVIDRIYPLENAADADNHLDAQGQFGRVVLAVAGDVPAAGEYI